MRAKKIPLAKGRETTRNTWENGFERAVMSFYYNKHVKGFGGSHQGYLPKYLLWCIA